MAWTALAAAAIGAYGSYASSKKQKEAMEAGARSSSTTQSSPWEPSMPARGRGLEYAQNILNMYAQDRPKGQNFWNSMPKWGGGGGGGGGGFGGSQEIADAMKARALGGHQLYGTSEDYIDRTLKGDSQNPYLKGTYDAYAGNMVDPNAQRFIDSMMGGGMPWGGDGGYSARTTAGPGYNIDPYLEDVLSGKRYSEGAAKLQDKAGDAIKRQYANDVVPGLASRYGGAGIAGGSAEALAGTQAEAEKAARIAQEMGVLEEDYARFNDQMNMQAIGQGVALDANRGQRQLQASAANASNQNQMDIARMGSLADMIQFGGQYRLGAMGGMGDMARLMSSDQQYALGMTPEITGLEGRDLGQAFGMQSQLDSARAAQAAQAYNARMNEWKTMAMMPWQIGAQYGNMVNAMSGGYGTNVQQGTQQMPYQGPSGWESALGGAATGLGLWNQFGGGGGQPNYGDVNQMYQADPSLYGGYDMGSYDYGNPLPPMDYVTSPTYEIPYYLQNPNG